MHSDKNEKTTKAQVKKQNQDLPNLPAASEEVNNEKAVKKQIKKTSKLQPDGKTDNTDHNSEN